MRCELYYGQYVSLFLAFPCGRSAKNGHLLPWVVLGGKCILVLSWGVNGEDKVIFMRSELYYIL